MLNLLKLASSGASPAQGHTAAQKRPARFAGTSGAADVPAPRQGGGAGAWSDERGGIALMTGLLAVPLIALSALAVDVGVWELNRSGMQGAADQAVLAAGLAKASGGNVELTARSVAAAHGFRHSQDGSITVTAQRPTTGNYSDDDKAIEVVIKQQQQVFLAKVIAGFEAPEASVRAVIATGVAHTCVMALAPSGTSLEASGSARFISNGCNIYVNSTSSSAVKLSDSAAVSGYDILLAGSKPTPSGSARISATHTLKENAAPATDPYASRVLPTPSSPCKKITVKTNEVTEVDEGNHCELKAQDTQHIRLKPGVHFVSGGSLDVSGSSKVTGTGVTLILGRNGSNYGDAKVSGSAMLDIDARRIGPTAGIALWMDKAGGKTVGFSGSARIKITGALYAPASFLEWSGSSSSPCTQLIAKTIKVSGSAGLRHDCDGYGVSDVPDNTYTLKE